MSGAPVWPVRGVVLDFDGVLVESEGVKTDIFRVLFSRYPDHFDDMMAYHRAHIAIPREVKFRYLASRCGAGEALVRELLGAFSEQAIERIASCPEVPGAGAFLEEFGHRVPLFLASVTPEPDLLEVLGRRAWRRHFAQVFGDPPTAKADAVRAVLTRVGVDADALLFVGDTLADYQVAHETGVPFIARDGGHWAGPPEVPSVADMAGVAALVRARLESA